MDYYYQTEVEFPVDEAVEKITEYMKTYGFGILTSIDVQKTLKDKIGAEIRPYRILGACNPNFANEVISKENNIGLMLPCNIIVRENEEGKTVIATINPETTIKSVGNDQLEFVAGRVRDVIQSLINNIGTL
ncbi:MAG TPA: DUF302 domain-containing protein [Bacteroidales bacterium]|nr:DUF302 domain-containing protein [Bacteroidales bacterium]